MTRPGRLAGQLRRPRRPGRRTPGAARSAEVVARYLVRLLRGQGRTPRSTPRATPATQDHLYGHRDGAPITHGCSEPAHPRRQRRPAADLPAGASAAAPSASTSGPTPPRPGCRRAPTGSRATRRPHPHARLGRPPGSSSRPPRQPAGPAGPRRALPHPLPAVAGRPDRLHRQALLRQVFERLLPANRYSAPPEGPWSHRSLRHPWSHALALGGRVSEVTTAAMCCQVAVGSCGGEGVAGVLVEPARPGRCG